MTFNTVRHISFIELCVCVCVCVCVWVHARVCTQSCLMLCDFVDCSPPGSSVHGISQARILERLPFLPPGDLPDRRTEPMSPELNPFTQGNPLPLNH